MSVWAMRAIRGVVLCGGRGSRLRPLSHYIPKSMIPIGLKEKPLLEYILRLMAYHGIRDVILLIGHKGAQIENYFRNGDFLGVRLTYLYDDPALPGTGGAVLNAIRQGLISERATYLIYYGDILSDIDLSEMLELHSSSGVAATLAVSTSYRLPVSVAELNGERIVGFEEKPALKVPVGIGILAIEGSSLKRLEEIYKSGEELDLMKHLLPYLIRLGLPVKAYITKAFWYDIGSLERYEKLDHGVIDERFSFLF